MERNKQKDILRYGKGANTRVGCDRRNRTELKRTKNRVNRLRYCHPAFWALGRGDN